MAKVNFIKITFCTLEVTIKNKNKAILSMQIFSNTCLTKIVIQEIKDFM